MPDMLVCDVHKARQGLLVNDRYIGASLRLYSCQDKLNAKYNACTSFLGTSSSLHMEEEENVGLEVWG